MTEHRQDESINKLANLICDIPVAILTTCRPDRSLHSRPMVNINGSFAGELWFFTQKSDPKVHEVTQNPEVNVSFVSPQDGRYVSVSGTATLVNDKSRAKLLWRDATCQKWFPQGVDDPDLSLLKVELVEAEYWDESTTAMRAMGGLLKGVFKGDHPEPLDHDTVHWHDKAKNRGKE